MQCKVVSVRTYVCTVCIYRCMSHQLETIPVLAGIYLWINNLLLIMKIFDDDDDDDGCAYFKKLNYIYIYISLYSHNKPAYIYIDIHMYTHLYLHIHECVWTKNNCASRFVLSPGYPCGRCSETQRWPVVGTCVPWYEEKSPAPAVISWFINFTNQRK